MVTVAHALVHGIRGTVSNLLFRLYVGQEWLSPATLSTGGAPEREGEEVDWCYVAALSSLQSPRFLYCRPLPLLASVVPPDILKCVKMQQLMFMEKSEIYKGFF